MLFPLNNSTMANTPDRKFFFGREEMLLKRYLGDLQISAPPKTLNDYIQQVVVATLQRQKQNGAVALKFEAAYLRALDFAPASQQQAAEIYARYAQSGAAPSKDEYKTVQDYILHALAVEAGRLGLPLHFHTGTGCGRYFQTAGSNPIQMESFLNDPALNKTTFVFIHGAWPLTEQLAAMLTRPNVYTDTSAQTFFVSQRRQSQSIRQWLEMMPEKVMFGTDLYAGDDPQYGWDTVGWQTSHNARDALALALTGMMQDGEITREQAIALANMVLHGNAEKLYGLK
jgi:predicted TIM-barrel fold metal-dependent hydrolase